MKKGLLLVKNVIFRKCGFALYFTIYGPKSYSRVENIIGDPVKRQNNF